MTLKKITPDKQIAVALGYDFDGADLPKVLAKGSGHVAEQILSLAFEQGIKVRQDKDLAQILSLVDIESEIPVEAMVAVAEILAYVYRENGIQKVASLRTLNPYRTSGPQNETS